MKNRLKTILQFAGIPLFLLVAFTATAFASGVVPADESSLLDLARPVYEAFLSKNYWMGAALSLIFVAALIKRYAPEKYGIRAFFNTDHGGAILVLVAAYGTALSAALIAVGPVGMSAGLAWGAFKVAVGAAGGYSFLKKILIPVVRWLHDKLPTWARAPLALFLALFDKPTAIDVAEDAGDEAVKANPPTGAPSSDVTEI